MGGRERCVNDRGDFFCQDCFDDLYVECSNCGTFYAEVAAECPRCAENPLFDHDYTPVLRWLHERKDDPLPTARTPYFGIELEIEAQDREKCVGIIKNNLPNTYCKSDGSLSCEGGVELVTHPMTLGYFKKQSKVWKSALAKLRSSGCASEDTTTCGLHIHISRAYIQKWDADVQKMRLFFYLCQPQIHKFSRRRSESDYAEFEHSRPNPHQTPQGRYWALNLDSHFDTVEVRVFKGTLGYNTLRGSVEFVHALAQFCRENSLAYFESFEGRVSARKLWKDFVDWMRSERTFSYCLKTIERLVL